MTALKDEALRELLAKAEKATPGPWYTCGLPWFQTGSGVLAGSPDPHVGFLIADTEMWDGEREEYLANQPAVEDLADPDDDAAYIAAANPATITALITETLSLRARLAQAEEALAGEREECAKVADAYSASSLPPDSELPADDPRRLLVQRVVTMRSNSIAAAIRARSQMGGRG